MNLKFKVIGLINTGTHLSIQRKNIGFNFASAVKYPRSSFVTKKSLPISNIPTILVFTLVPTISIWYSSNSISTNHKLNKFITNYILLSTTFLVSLSLF